MGKGKGELRREGRVRVSCGATDLVRARARTRVRDRVWVRVRVRVSCGARVG